MKISKIVNYTVIFLEIVILIIFLIWRFKLGITRYFDIDEFAHLHWGYSLFIGERPYTDFFYLFPPFFLYVISSLIAVWGRSVTMLLSARILIFTASAGSAFIILQLGKKMRSLSFGLLAAIVFIFLPLPSDKLLEIRPDNIAIFLALLGLYLFILGEEKQRKKYLFFSGLCYSVSLGIVPKTVFFLIPPMLQILSQCHPDRTSQTGEWRDLSRFLDFETHRLVRLFARNDIKVRCYSFRIRRFAGNLVVNWINDDLR